MEESLILAKKVPYTETATVSEQHQRETSVHHQPEHAKLTCPSKGGLNSQNAIFSSLGFSNA
jgi:hypothetical protein